MVRNRSCPAVSHIWSFIVLPARSVALSVLATPSAHRGCPAPPQPERANKQTLQRTVGRTIQIDGPNFEVDTDGGDVALRVGVVRESQQQALFADCTGSTHI